MSNIALHKNSFFYMSTTDKAKSMINLDKGMSYIDIVDCDTRLEVDTAVRDVCAPSWSWDHNPKHWQLRPPSVLVWLVHRGGAELRTSHGSIAVKRGDFLLMPSEGCEYHGRHNRDKTFEVTWLFFRAPGVQGSIGGVEGMPFCSVLTDVAFAEDLMARLLLSSGSMRGVWLRTLLDEVRRQTYRHSQTLARQRMQELGERIRANPGRYRGLNDMVLDYPYSKDHLIRLFRRCHTVTPGEFLIRARMDSARGLLAASVFSIKQIASQLGYADAFCFSRQFKARTGLSPSAFRAGGPLAQ